MLVTSITYVLSRHTNDGSAYFSYLITADNITKTIASHDTFMTQRQRR